MPGYSTSTPFFAKACIAANRPIFLMPFTLAGFAFALRIWNARPKPKPAA